MEFLLINVCIIFSIVLVLAVVAKLHNLIREHRYYKSNIDDIKNNKKVAVVSTEGKSVIVNFYDIINEINDKNQAVNSTTEDSKEDIASINNDINIKSDINTVK